MNWKVDKCTEQAARANRLLENSNEPADQFDGRRFNSETWSDRVIQPSVWPAGELKSSPEQIISQFKNGDRLQALAMIVSWGTMWRHPKKIWGTRELPDIDQTLQYCIDSIQTTESVADAWRMLTGQEKGQLGWSEVITSKTLHFLCRSIGFEEYPPVAIDGAVMRKNVWPAFVKLVPAAERPDDWQGNTFDAYSRYMSAILTWAKIKKWTTTQIETTLFALYRKA